MSIFPKRAIPGNQVTIHWNFNTPLLKDTHIFPWVKIGVKDPNGKVTMLHEGYILALPNEENKPSNDEKPKLKYLRKNLPFTVIADYLSGKNKRETLIDILQNIQSGRHYYFTLDLPNDAPLGKYTLISEVHNSGHIRYSKTIDDDFFWVEKISAQQQESDSQTFKIINHSPEPTPVKMVNCFFENEKLKTKIDIFELQREEEKIVTLQTKFAYLSYNEERQFIPLFESNPTFLLRNQQVLSISKEASTVYLVKKDQDDAYELQGNSKILWEKADGLLTKEQLTDQEIEVLDEMIKQDLIHEVKFF